MDNTESSEAVVTEDFYKSSGQIVFRMTNFKAFLEGPGAKSLSSDTTEHIRGMPWRIVIESDGGYLGFFVRCGGSMYDVGWSCKADYKLSVVPPKKDEECLAREGSGAFMAFCLTHGQGNFAKFEELMDPNKGIYDEEGDSVTFKAKVTAHMPKGLPGIQTADPLLVNEKMVYVNKHNLAAYSKFFHNLFFGPMAKQLPKVPITEEEGGLSSFERLIATMPPQSMELDDECVENVLHLADFFMLDIIVNRCADFLYTKSKKSAIQKFRLAKKYDIICMKDQILKNMNKADFDVRGEIFYNIFSELNKLDDEAARELRAKYDGLF